MSESNLVQWKGTLLGALCLALATLILHGGALFGGWMFDDGPQLLFAATYSPWQYFGDADVLRQQSYAHIAPWNAFFFDLGIPVFGLWAAGHYAHLLVVVWLTAVATWQLLGRWLSNEMALGGALLFLAMPSTGAVAHMLMTGHYAYGLLFCALMLMAFAQAVQTSSLRWATLAAVFYGLGCLCKELYVPLAAVPLAWPHVSRRMRWALATPTVTVAAVYALMRLHVLGGLGGYAALAADETSISLDLGGVAVALGRLHAALFGPGWAGLLALGIAASCVGVAWWRKRRPAGIVLAAATVVILTPVAPLLLIHVPNGLERVLLLAGWALAILVVWHLDVWPAHRRGVVAVIAALMALLVAGQRGVVTDAENSQRAMIAQNDFISRAGPTDVLVPADFGGVGLLETMRAATALITHRGGATLVGSEEDFLALGEERGRQAWAWHAECNCVRQLGEAYPRQAQSIRARWSAGQGLPLEMKLELRNSGRVKAFRWAVHGTAGQLYLEARNEVRLALPQQGALAFGLDATFRPPDPIALRMIVVTPDQATVRTPWFALPLSASSVVDWKGVGQGPPLPH